MINLHIRWYIIIISKEAIIMPDFPKRITVTAHTGAENTPDNSIESVKKAIFCGADIFEIDIRFDKDEKPIITHNAPDGNDPSLEEVFAVMAEDGKIMCNLDLKETTNLPEIYRLAEKYGLCERIFYTGVVKQFVDAVKDNTPQIAYYRNIDILLPLKRRTSYITEMVNKVKECGAVGINLHHSGLSHKLVNAFHKEGLLVSVWTVNKKRTMKKIIRMAPDNITSRCPVLLKEMLDDK